MRPIIYFRAGNECADQEEIAAASKYFTCITQRARIQKDDFVIPRYSFLPFGKELEEDVKYLGGKLINSYYQHCYVADLQNYYYDLCEVDPNLTFLTWNKLSDLPDDCQFVVKGKTNSKKFEWNTKCWAANKQEAARIFDELSNDGFLCYQDIYFRKFEKLKTYFISLNGLPITKEFRFFVAYGKVISSGYYWSGFEDQLEKVPSPEEVPKEFLQRVIDIIGTKVPFVVIDVAEREDGSPVVVELNDGCQSGLSMNDPEILYKNLYQRLIDVKAI